MVTARGWAPNALNEDIITFVQSLNPEFEPNPEITVDDCVQIAPEDKRPDAPKVWFVLRNPSLFTGNMTVTGGGILNSMPESFATDERAKLIAKRFDAFNYYMSFARENRRGNWNLNYTAKNAINYFRQQYNKPLI
jgi:hypothetical protein